MFFCHSYPDKLLILNPRSHYRVDRVSSHTFLTNMDIAKLLRTGAETFKTNFNIRVLRFGVLHKAGKA